MAEKKRIVWIDQLRGLAFYTVILGHMSIGKSLKNWLYSFHMPLFFIAALPRRKLRRPGRQTARDFSLSVPCFLSYCFFPLRFSYTMQKEQAFVNYWICGDNTSAVPG